MKKISINWVFTIFIVLLFLFLWWLKEKEIIIASSYYYEDYVQNNILYEILWYILTLFWTIPALITNILFKKELTKSIKIVTSIVAVIHAILTLSPFIPYIDSLLYPLMMLIFFYSWKLFPAYYLLTIFVIKYKTKKLKQI